MSCVWLRPLAESIGCVGDCRVMQKHMRTQNGDAAVQQAEMLCLGLLFRAWIQYVEHVLWVHVWVLMSYLCHRFIDTMLHAGCGVCAGHWHQNGAC